MKLTFSISVQDFKWANLSFAPFAQNFIYAKVKVQKNQALVAQNYNAIHQAPVFFFLIVDNIITRCLPLQKGNGKRFFVSLYWKIPGSNEASEKVVLFSFSGRNISNGSCYIC